MKSTDLNVAHWVIELMTLLPTGGNGKGKTVEDLVNDLLKNPKRTCRTDNEKKALIHKVQSTLKDLSEDVTWGPKLLCCVKGENGLLEERIAPSRKKTYWKWKDSKETLILPPPNENACLALLMVENRLKEELPPATLEYLQPHFDKAKERIQNSGPGNQYMQWQKKIINQSPTQPLSPTGSTKEVHDAVLKSLFDDCQLEFTYCKPKSDKPKTYVVCPLGLLMRGPITYLIACKVSGNGQDTDAKERMFALHRIEEAKVLDGDKARAPSGVTLENFVKRGGSDFVIGNLANGQIINLQMNVNSSVALRLKETPLTDDQMLKDTGDGKYRLTANLPITMQLGWWVLGFGPRVEVINPPAFREWIAAEHRNAANHYENK